MATQAKIDQVAEITDLLDTCQGFFVVNYRGLTVKDAQELRRSLRANGAQMSVFKNNLVRRALADKELPEVEYLVGPTACVFFESDPVAPAKVLKDFAKAHPVLDIKGGLSEGAVVDEAQVKAIAELPSREELLAKMLGTLQNPLVKTVRVLNGPAEAFARVVQAIADQKNAA